MAAFGLLAGLVGFMAMAGTGPDPASNEITIDAHDEAPVMAQAAIGPIMDVAGG